MFRKILGLGPLAAAPAVTVALSGCGALDKKPVCSGTPQHVVVIASTSTSDLAVSQQMAPVVAKQAVERAVKSCGSISVGMFGGRHAEADLMLRTHTFTPTKTSTYGDVTPILKPLKDDGQKFIETNLLNSLVKAEPRPGSPFLNGLAATSLELHNRHIATAAVVMIGDGIAVERGRKGERINFGSKHVNTKAVDAFATLYGPLKGSCVILTGSGANATLSDEQIRTARGLLGGVTTKAGARFVSTRDDDEIPWAC